jgi:HlyD family secretion protein
MKVNVRIHESKIRRIKTGLPVAIRLPAFADEVFHGVLDTVSPLPMSGNWPNYDLREYEAVVRITDSGIRKGELKPGMTASVEIMIAQLNDVLLAPLQGVINAGTKHFAFVLKEDGPERRELSVGEASDSMVQILDGIGEHERVILNPRTRFADEIAKLEATYGAPPSDEPSKAAEGTPAAGSPAKGSVAESKAGDAPKGDAPEAKKEGRRKGRGNPDRKDAPRNEGAT